MATWRNRIVGEGEQLAGWLFIRRTGDLSAFNALMASGAKGDEIGKSISGFPVSVKEVSGPDVMDVQVTQHLGALSAYRAGGAVAGESSTALASPVARILATPAPARTIGGVVWSEDRQGTTLAGAVEVGVLADDRRRDAVGLATALAGDQRFGFAVAIDRGAAQGTEDVLSLFGASPNNEDDPALFARQRREREPRSHVLLVLPGAVDITGAEARKSPAMHLDSLAAERTSSGQQIVDAGLPVSVSFDVLMIRMLHNAPAAAIA